MYTQSQNTQKMFRRRGIFSISIEGNNCKSSIEQDGKCKSRFYVDLDYKYISPSLLGDLIDR